MATRSKFYNQQNQLIIKTVEVIAIKITRTTIKIIKYYQKQIKKMSLEYMLVKINLFLIIKKT